MSGAPHRMMPGTPEDTRFWQVAQRVAPHSQVLRVWPLTGGVSAQVVALELKQADGQQRRVVVRRHGAADRQRNPHIAADEYRLLTLLQAHGIPSTAPYFVDQSGEIFPTPYLVIEYIEGQPEFHPPDLVDYITQLATHLSRIHRVGGSPADFAFLPQLTARVAHTLQTPPATFDHTLNEGRIREVLRSVWPLAPSNPPTLLHGDFWPGNLLWREGQLVAILDWEDAHLGDPLADVANTRLELLWALGSDAMEQFTQHYQGLMAVESAALPYWDLYAALKPAGKLAGWGLDPQTEQQMRAHHQRFVAQALAWLSLV